MKIKLYWEDNHEYAKTTFEIPEDDFSVMVELDYQERLEKAEDGEIVERRDPQTILNEEISKKTYNSNHKETRRHASYDKMDAKGGVLCDSGIARKKNTNGKTYVQVRNFLTRQKTLEEEVFGTEEDDLYAALAAMPDEQRNLLLNVYADDVDQRVIADDDGVTESAISHRKERALARLKKELKKVQKKFD